MFKFIHLTDTHVIGGDDLLFGANPRRRLELAVESIATDHADAAFVVITGDLSQIDLPHGQPSGLADAVGLLENVAGVGIIHLSGDDVVRHPVVARILRAYEAGQTP